MSKSKKGHHYKAELVEPDLRSPKIKKILRRMDVRSQRLATMRKLGVFD